MRIKLEYKRETTGVLKKQSEIVNYIYTSDMNLFKEKSINSECLNENVKSPNDFYKLKSITSDSPTNMVMEILFFDVALNDIPKDISKDDIPLLFTTDIFDVKNPREHNVKINFDVYDKDLNFVHDYISKIIKQEADFHNYDGAVIKKWNINETLKNKSISEVRKCISDEIYRLNDLIYG